MACPDVSYAYNALAWFQATCPQAPYRDGKKAVENANRAMENKYLQYTDITANNVADAKKRIALYQAHQPYREGK